MTALHIAILAFPLIVTFMPVTAQPTQATIDTINAEGRAIDDLARAIPSLQNLAGNVHPKSTSFFGRSLLAFYASFNKCR